MKKYEVSLGVKIRTNWKIGIEAIDEKDAKQKAIQLFTDNNLADPYYDEAELMGDDAIYVEEIE